MSVADQIGFGVCLALIPYLLWTACSAAISAILGRLLPEPAPIQLNRIITYTHLFGVVSDASLSVRNHERDT